MMTSLNSIILFGWTSPFGAGSLGHLLFVSAHCSSKELHPFSLSAVSRSQLNPRLIAPLLRGSLSSSSDDGVPRHTIHPDASVHTPPGPADSVVQYRNIAVLTPAVHGLNAQTLGETAFNGSRPEIHSIVQPPL